MTPRHISRVPERIATKFRRLSTIFGVKLYSSATSADVAERQYP